MKIDFKEEAAPKLWLLEGVVEFDGKDYPFWYELDERDGAEVSEFTKDEPEGNFDFEEFERQCKAKLEESFRIVQELDKPRSGTDEDLERQCREIAGQLSNRLAWAKEHAEYHDITDQEEIDALGGYEWLEDVLDIRYIVGRDGQFISAQVLVAFGGPNIWVNFDEKYVKGYWGGDKAEAHFSDDIGVEDALEELYDSAR